MNRMHDHQFGGLSTDLKLTLVEGYLKAFTTALRPIFRELWYIDAFAGTGFRTKHLAAAEASLVEPAMEEQVLQLRGSAKIALDVSPEFDRIILIDQSKRHCDALRNLAFEYGTRRVDVLEGDANLQIRFLLDGQKWNNRRAVMFLDPYGMNVDWETLKLIKATEAIDVWYLVSLAGMFRQAARKGNALDEGKRAALTRMLGTDEWEQKWYEAENSPDLFGHTQDSTSRTANVDRMEDYMRSRLSTLFPKVLKPLRLNNDRGAPMFALFFAISNPVPQAIGLATKIANHMLTSGRLSQVRP